MFRARAPAASASLAGVSAADRRVPPWRGFALGAILGGLVTLALFAPAVWLADWVTEASGGRVVLADARGSMWRGSAELTLTGGAGSRDARALPSRLEWKLTPGFSGIDADLTSACCAPAPVRIHAAPRWGGARVTLADGASSWPAQLLAGLGTPWNTLQFDGDLRLETRGLSIEWIEGRLSLSGTGTLTAERVSSRLSTLRPMGSYRIVMTGGASPTLQLSTLEGALQLSGNGQWTGSGWRFTGEATAAPDREAALANLLNIIGRRNGARSVITLG